MPSFLESVSDAASGRSSSEGKKKRKKDEGKGLTFQDRLSDLFGSSNKKKKKD